MKGAYLFWKRILLPLSRCVGHLRKTCADRLSPGSKIIATANQDAPKLQCPFLSAQHTWTEGVLDTAGMQTWLMALMPPVIPSRALFYFFLAFPHPTSVGRPPPTPPMAGGTTASALPLVLLERPGHPSSLKVPPPAPGVPRTMLSFTNTRGDFINIENVACLLWMCDEVHWCRCLLVS